MRMKIKATITMFLAIIIFCSMMVVNVNAAADNSCIPMSATVKTTDTSLNVRKDATTTSSILGTVPKNGFISVVGYKTDTGSSDTVWYKIANPAGYVRSDFIMADDNHSISAYVKTQDGDPLNVRDAANGTKIGTISNKSSVTVTSFAAGSDGYMWYKVTSPQKSGYVRADFITASTTSSSTPSPTPSPSDAKIKSMSNNTDTGSTTLTSSDTIVFTAVFNDVTSTSPKKGDVKLKLDGDKNYYPMISSDGGITWKWSSGSILARTGRTVTVYVLSGNTVQSASPDLGGATIKHTSPSYAFSVSSSSLGTVGTVEKMDWKNAKTWFKAGTVATITDVRSGAKWTMKRIGGSNHADSIILTRSERDIFFNTVKVNNKWTWNRRPIFVTINGRTSAASMHGMPHGGCGLTGTGMEEPLYSKYNNLTYLQRPGHICIHFLNSTGHANPTVCPKHKACVEEAYAARNKFTLSSVSDIFSASDVSANEFVYEADWEEGELHFWNDDEWYYWFEDEEGLEGEILEVSNTTWAPPASAESMNVSIKSDALWTASSNDTSWLTVTPTNGTDNGSITLTVSNNMSTKSRIGTITITAESFSKTITVTQAGASDATITLSANTASSLSFDVVFPISCNPGNRIELQDTVTGLWMRAGNDFFAESESYTFSDLIPGRQYVARLSYFDGNTWISKPELSVFTNAPEAKITLSATTPNSLSFNVVFPISGNHGNKIELYDAVTGTWSTVGNDGFATNGEYTFNNLIAGKQYMARLEYFDGDTWVKTPGLFEYTLLRDSKIALSASTTDSLTFNVGFLNSDADGNKLELQDTVTGDWIAADSGDRKTADFMVMATAENDNNITNGTYTFSDLVPGRQYTGRLTYKDGSIWESHERVAFTNAVSPTLELKECTSNSISFDVTFLASGVKDNRIQLFDTVTKEWNTAGNDFYVTNGTYTFDDLVPGRRYIGRIVYNNGTAPITSPEQYITTPEPEEPETFAVILDANNGTAKIGFYIDVGDKIIRPEDPGKNGFCFVGWFAGTDIFDFDSIITGDITLTAKWIVSGDVDGDSNVTIFDALLLLDYISGKQSSLAETQLLAADVDGDGKPTIFDALRVLDFVAGKLTEL